MAVSKVAIERELYQSLRQYVDDRFCLDILLFLGAHPHTRFSLLAIVHALGTQRLYVEHALRHLIDKGVVREYADSNPSYYSLTGDESLRRLIADLSRLDWRQWRSVLEETCPSFAMSY